MPAGVIVAMLPLDDTQVTWLVKSFVDLSEYVPVAVNWLVAPATMLGSGGRHGEENQGRWANCEHRRAGHAIERGTDRGRSRRIDLARPRDPAALEIVATDVAADDQVTWPVSSGSTGRNRCRWP